MAFFDTFLARRSLRRLQWLANKGIASNNEATLSCTRENILDNPRQTAGSQFGPGSVDEDLDIVSVAKVQSFATDNYFFACF